jgi:hypothetical protein
MRFLVHFHTLARQPSFFLAIEKQRQVHLFSEKQRQPTFFFSDRKNNGKHTETIDNGSKGATANFVFVSFQRRRASQIHANAARSPACHSRRPRARAQMQLRAQRATRAGPAGHRATPLTPARNARRLRAFGAGSRQGDYITNTMHAAKLSGRLSKRLPSRCGCI